MHQNAQHIGFSFSVYLLRRILLSREMKFASAASFLCRRCVEPLRWSSLAERKTRKLSKDRHAFAKKKKHLNSKNVLHKTDQDTSFYLFIALMKSEKGGGILILYSWMKKKGCKVINLWHVAPSSS